MFLQSLNLAKGKVSRGIIFNTMRTMSSTDSQVQKADVLIVGGGIAGASLACALSQSEYFSPEN
jgi:ribulose 1,5-bisphosphate synthetase/thiazole synthase